MGLDMYLFRIRKPKIEFPELVTAEWLDSNGLSYFDKERMNDDDAKELKDCVIQISCEVPVIDEEKIKKTYGLEGYDCVAACSIISGSHFSLRFVNRKEGKEKLMNLSREECLKRVMMDYAVFETEEVFYWRKEYEIEEYIYDLLGRRVENCGYYKMTQGQINNLVRYCLENHPDSWHGTCIYPRECEEGEGYFYYEWY